MDPITIALIASGGVSAVVALIAALRSRRQRAQPPALPPPEVEQQREEPSDQTPPRQKQRRAPPEPEGLTPSTLIHRILAHIQFSAKRVKVGDRVVQGEYIGVEEVERPFPADGIDVRPLQDMVEVPALLPQEVLLDDDLLFARLAAGEALVEVHIERVDVYEEVHEPIWEERRRVLYLLLDVSPSMYPSDGPSWRMKVWSALSVALLGHALENEALFYCREFSNGTRGLMRVLSAGDAGGLRRRLQRPPPGNGTDIGDALRTAIRDLVAEEYDQGEILILTDGEDHGGMDPTALRAQLDEAGLRLHAILLGVDNDSLRQAAHRYQVIEYLGNNRFEAHDLVRQS